MFCFHRRPGYKHVASILACIHVLAVLRCASGPKTKQTESLRQLADLEELAYSKFQSKAMILPNRDKDYALCIKYDDKISRKEQPLVFFVVKMDEKQIVYEDRKPFGHVDWISPHSIEVKEYPGIVRGEKLESQVPTSYIYNVKTGKKGSPTSDQQK